MIVHPDSRNTDAVERITVLIFDFILTPPFANAYIQYILYHIVRILANNFLVCKLFLNCAEGLIAYPT